MYTTQPVLELERMKVKNKKTLKKLKKGQTGENLIALLYKWLLYINKKKEHLIENGQKRKVRRSRKGENVQMY